MTSFGVLPTGFSLKTLETVLQELEDAEKATLGADINTTSTSVIGQLNGIFGDKIAELWEVAQALYASQYPDSASGAALDLLVGLIGLARLAKARSTTNLVLNIGSGATVPAGSVVSSSQTGLQFSTTTAAVNGGAYPANVTVPSQALLYGALIANPRSLDTINSPISGWDPSVAINAVNAEPYGISAGNTLLIKVDGGSAQTVTFNGGDTTAALVSTRINAAVSGALATDVGGYVRLTSSSDLAGNSLEISGGNAAPILAFPSGLFKGFNPSNTAAFVTSGSVQTFALSGGETLTVKVDDAAVQTVTFQAGDFASAGNATAIEVARRISTDLTNPPASAVRTATNNVIIRSSNNLATSTIEVTGGSANAVLNFTTTRTVAADIASSTVGRDEETDTELRRRRLASLSAVGSGTLAAIRANLLSISGVSQVGALENDTDTGPDANGLPAHSFSMVVQGGADQDILDSIREHKPAGIESYGTTSGTSYDTEGNPYTIEFSRPSTVDFYVDVVLEYVASEYPVDGDTQVRQAMVDIFDSLLIGRDVVTLPVKCSALDIAGVHNVSSFKIGTAPSPATDPGKVTITPLQLARLALTNINITKTNYTDL